MGALKILVVVLVLLIAAAIIASPNGLDTLGNFTDKVKGWIDAGLGGLGSAPAATGAKQAHVSLGPAGLAFTPDAPLNVTSGSVHVNGFSGVVNISPSEVRLSEKATGLELSLPANGTVLSGLKINSWSLSEIPFYISPNITASGGNITIAGFYGTGTTDSGKLALDGNFSRVKAGMAGITLEI